MPSRLRLLAAAAALGGVGSPALGASDEPTGRLGFRFQPLEEGLLVTSVVPGMGAEQAGVEPGSLVLSVDGKPLTGLPEKPRAALIGPPSSIVQLELVPPLSTEARTVEVERQLLVPRAARELPHRPGSVRAYRKAARDKWRRSAMSAAQAMVDDDFGGLAPREAVGGSLATLMRRGDRFARDVAEILATGAQDDPALLQGLARVLLETGEPEQAVALLERRAELVGPELQLAEGTAVDVGESFQARALYIDALSRTGRAADAAEGARSLLATHRDPGVASLVSMAPPDVQAEWRAELPPLPSFELSLLDGSTWSSADWAGQVVVVNFWATWCGPCKQELPELAELYERRKSDGVEVLAVSVDTGPSEKVQAMADRLKLPFSVGIAPSLGPTFQVSAYPSIRVLGGDGALHYSARGYSSAAMEKLDQAIDQAMEGSRAPVASVWGEAAGTASLTRFFPVAGAAGVHASPDGVVVGVLGAAPLFIDPRADAPAEASVETSRGMPGQRVGWLNGAVAADPGRLFVRKWSPEGELEWLRRLPETVTDLVVHDDAVWVSARDHLYVFAADGTQLGVVDVALTDLAAGAEQVVGAGPQLGFSGRLSPLPPPPESPAEESEPAVIEADGEEPPPPAVQPRELRWETSPRDDDLFVTSGAADRAGGVVSQVVRGRFGPDGAERVAVVRADDRLLVFDGEGQPAVVVELRRAGDLVAVDFDGDGQDSIVVGVPDHGVAWIDLTVP